MQSSPTTAIDMPLRHSSMILPRQQPEGSSSSRNARTVGNIRRTGTCLVGRPLPSWTAVVAAGSILLLVSASSVASKTTFYPFSSSFVQQGHLVQPTPHSSVSEEDAVAVASARTRRSMQQVTRHCYYYPFSLGGFVGQTRLSTCRRGTGRRRRGETGGGLLGEPFLSSISLLLPSQQHHRHQQEERRRRRHLLRSCTTLMMPSSHESKDEELFSATTTTNDANPLLDRKLPSPLILGSASFTRKLILQERMSIPYVVLTRPIDERNIGDRSKDADPRLLVETLAMAKMDHLIEGITEGNIDCDISVTTSTKAEGGEEEEGGGRRIYDETKTTTTRRKVSELIGTDTEGEGVLVLTGDQVVTHPTMGILEKPTSIEQAIEFAACYGRSPPQTVGAVVLTHLPSLTRAYGVDTATIHFKSTLSEDDNAEILVGKLVEDGAPVLNAAGGLLVEHPLVREYVTGIDGTEESVMGLSVELVLQLLDEMKDKLSSL